MIPFFTSHIDIRASHSSKHTVNRMMIVLSMFTVLLMISAPICGRAESAFSSRPMMPATGAGSQQNGSDFGRGFVSRQSIHVKHQPRARGSGIVTDGLARSYEALDRVREAVAAAAASVHQHNASLSNELQAASSKISLGMPEAVVVGMESAGKTSLVSAIVGHHVGFSDPDLATRRPVRYILERTDPINDNGSDYNEVHVHDPLDETCEYQVFENGWCRLPSTEYLHRWVKVKMMALRELPAGKQFSVEPLEVRMKGPDLPNLVLVDTPGVHSEKDHASQCRDFLMPRVILKATARKPGSIIVVVKMRPGRSPRDISDLEAIYNPLKGNVRCDGEGYATSTD